MHKTDKMMKSKYCYEIRMHEELILADGKPASRTFTCYKRTEQEALARARQLKETLLEKSCYIAVDYKIERVPRVQRAYQIQWYQTLIWNNCKDKTAIVVRYISNKKDAIREARETRNGLLQSPAILKCSFRVKKIRRYNEIE